MRGATTARDPLRFRVRRRSRSPLASAGRRSRRAAALRFGVSESSAIRWVRRLRKVGSRQNAGTGGHRRSALKPHVDPDDLFVLQLEGRKRWNVYGWDPLWNQGARDQLPPITLEAELAPGDLLYVPQHWIHMASAGEDFSFALTVGFRPISWADVLGALSTRHLFGVAPHEEMTPVPDLDELLHLPECPRGPAQSSHGRWSAASVSASTPGNPAGEPTNRGSASMERAAPLPTPTRKPTE